MSTLNRKFQSPLGRARGYGSAHDGAHHWLMERVTSAALIPLVLWLVWSIVNLRGASHGEFTTWLALPWNAILMMLVIAVGFYHAVLGLQVVIEDYVADNGPKLVMILGVKTVFAVMGVASLFSILKIAL